MNHVRPHRKRILATAVAFALLLIFSASITAYAMSSRTVLINDDGTRITTTTTKSDAIDILRTQKITLGNDDRLDLSAFSPDTDSVIRIYRAKKVYLIDGEEVRHVTSAGTVKNLLEQNGVYDTLKERDKVSYEMRDLLFDGMEVVVSRAFDVLVRDYGNDYNLTLTEGTVAQALESAGITLEGEDFVQPEPEAELYPGMTIYVSRVDYRERTRESAIDFEVQTKDSKTMDLGMVKIEQKGVKGKKSVDYMDKYINGERVDSVVLREVVLQEPVKEIKIVGTKVARLTAGTKPISLLTPPSSVEIVNGVPTNYKEVVVGTAKAYSTGYGTASGLPLKPGHIAVDPKQFPYGTKLYVVSNDGNYIYGYCIAADTGGFVKINDCTIDLYMPNEAMCEQWGHRGVTIYVLDEPRMQTPYG